MSEVKEEQPEITQNKTDLLKSLKNIESPSVDKQPPHYRHSRLGVETLSIMEFREDLGSFDQVFETEVQGSVI